MAATVPTISYAKTNRESKKGEDFSAAVIKDDAAPAAFAVFDGHSGMETARICSEKVCQRLIEMGPPFQAAAVADVLWAVDEEIGTQKIMDGATSQLLLVEKNGDGMRGMFAWTGDSSAVVADMATGKRVFATDSHTAGPDHQGGGAYASERERLEHFRAVRTAVEATGLDTQRDEVGAEAVRTAIADTGKEPTDESVALLVRAFRRSRIIAQTNPDGCETKKQVHVRQRDKDHDTNQVWVVSTGPKHGEPGYHDLQMTRSICERPGSNQSAGRRRAVAGASWQSRSQSTAVAH